MDEDRASLDEFGRFVMENLRDRGLQRFEFLAAGKWRAPRLQALQAAVVARTEDERDVIRRCVVECIDGAIHDFLFALQERADRIRVLVTARMSCP